MLNERFSAIVEALEKLPFDAVLDGEVVVLDPDGRANFQLLQNYLRTGRGTLYYYVFDLLYLNGRDLRGFPLRRRKYILKQVLPELPHVRISDHIEENGTSLFQAVKQKGIEGILAKNASSPYRAGIRGKDWLKVKTILSQEAVIGGYTAPRGGRKYFGSLVLGVYENEALVYIGHSGGGLADKELAVVHSKLEKLIVETSPFKDPPDTNTPVTWVRPELVCNILFSEWTDDGFMRHPIFDGLREDKSPTEVKREKPEKTADTVKKPRLTVAAREKERITIDGTPLELSHLDKIFWPDEGYTKGDMIEYYRGIAPVILPYLKDRPESMHRFPDGIYGESFFQKDIADKFPPWVKTASVRSESERKEIRYVLCQDEPSLIYMVNLGCIEINPWNSRIATSDYPDYIVLDFDPLEIDFRHVVEAALVTRDVLEQAGAKSYCKTSGATGLHICVPVNANYSTDQVQQFAKLINMLAHDRLPDTTSIERAPNRRTGRVYLDYLQNRRGQTIAAPYCIRPRRGAPVSAPLRWNEVNSRLDPAKFNMKNMKRRIDKVGDLWQGVLGPGIDMESCLDKLTEQKKKTGERHP